MPAGGGGAAYSRRRRWGAVLLAAAAAGFSQGAAADDDPVPKEDPWTLPSQEPPEISIPRAAERPISVEDGPRARVEAFVLDVDPSLRDALGPQLMTELEALAEGERVKQPPEGFTIGQMEEVAGKVRDFLRSRDFIVAFAFLPTQTVEDGRVTIGVLSGELGAIAVEGNRIMSAERLSAPFASLQGQPLQKKALERAILTVRDYPGVAPAAVLSPGTEVGTSDLTLRVLERRADVSTVVDNYGTEETGEGRARVRVDWNNPLRRGDKLTLNVLQTFSPAEGTFGGVAYEMPLGTGGFSLGALYDENAFDITVDGVDIAGESSTAALFARQKLIRGRELNTDLRFALESKEAEYDYSSQTGNEDVLTVASIAVDFEAVDRIGPLGVNSLTVEYFRGIPDFLGAMDEDGVNDNGTFSTRVGASGERAGGDFEKVTLRYQRLQQLSPANSLILRVYGQYTDDLLTAIEQMAGGGPYSVRAYPTAEYLVDKGAFGSAEYTLNVSSLLEVVPDRWDLNASLFYDYMDGEVRDALPTEREDVRLGGWGVGLDYEFRWGNGNGIMLRAEVAKPHTAPEASNGRDTQYWLRFEYYRR